MQTHQPIRIGYTDLPNLLELYMQTYQPIWIVYTDLPTYWDCIYRPANLLGLYMQRYQPIWIGYIQTYQPTLCYLIVGKLFFPPKTHPFQVINTPPPPPQILFSVACQPP